MKKHFFLTGLPSIGKTTALFRILQLLNKRTSGFHTEEIRIGSRRAGLNLITSEGSRVCVATRGEGGPFRTGKYVLNSVALEAALRALWAGTNNGRVIYADPVGTLVCRSPYFIEIFQQMLQTQTVIGTIAKRGHSFVEEIHRRDDCEILEVTADNRDRIPEAVLERINS